MERFYQLCNRWTDILRTRFLITAIFHGSKNHCRNQQCVDSLEISQPMNEQDMLDENPANTDLGYTPTVIYFTISPGL